MFDFRYPTPLPSTKGWGPGFPNCQPVAREGVSIFFPGVHKRIAPLVTMLVDEMREDPRWPGFLVPGCWGYGCRGTKSSSGSVGDTPSFHSWGLGFDINAPLNPFGNDRENTQLGKPEFSWVIDLWHEYGFFWLGPAIRDWMHFSFCGSPEDADRMTLKAREEGLGVALTDAQKEAIAEARATANGFEDYLAGKTPADLPILAHPARVRTLRVLRETASLPAPSPAPVPAEVLKSGDILKVVKT